VRRMTFSGSRHCVKPLPRCVQAGERAVDRVAEAVRT